MTHPADIQDIARLAAILVGKAEALGVTLRITGEPLRPLAMGRQRHVIDARAARHGPQNERVYSVVREPTGKTTKVGTYRESGHQMSDREWATTPANLREGCTTHVPGVGDI